MLESHYAPRTPLFLLPNTLSALTPVDMDWVRSVIQHHSKPDQPIGLLLIGGDADEASKRLSTQIQHPVTCRTLSQNGNLNEAARNLFNEMRHLDTLGLPLIFAEPCAEPVGLGYAIADRLKRASVRDRV